MQNGKQRTLPLPWLPLGLLAVLISGLLLAGRAYYRHEVREMRQVKAAALQAIAELKVGQIAAWRNERLVDARLVVSGLMQTRALQWLRAPDDKASLAALATRMRVEMEAQAYQNIVLASADGDLMVSLDPRLTALEASALNLVRQVVEGQSAVFGELFRCPDCKQIHLDVAAPVLDQDERTVAVLILRSDPQVELYPLVQSWPTPSASAETLLVRKQGDRVLFLNTLRHNDAPALTVNIPMSSSDLPAARALAGQRGIFEGKDYRGVAVESDMRPVPGSPWFMIAKMDMSEIEAEARYRGVAVSIVLGLAILMVVVSGLLAFSYRQRQVYEKLYRAEQKQRAAQDEIRATLYGIGDGVIATDAESRVTRMNPVAEALTGWPEREALGRPLKEVFRIVNEDTRAEVENPVVRVLRDNAIVGLANHTLLISRDGSERPIADSGSPVHMEGEQIAGVVLVFRDQTAERRAQDALSARAAFTRSVLDAVGANIAVLDRNGLIVATNEAWDRFARENAGPDVETAVGVGADYLAVLRTAAASSVEGAADTLACVEQVLAGQEQECSLEYSCHSPGVERWFMLRATPLTGEAGGVVLAHIDISNSKRAEMKMEASERRYRQVFSTAGDAMFLVDQASGAIVDANDAACRLYGYNRAEFLTLRKADLSEDAEKAKQALAQEQTAVLLRRHRNNDGTMFPVEITVGHYDDDGRRVSVVNVRDMSEDERAKQREQATQEELRRHLADIQQSRQALLSMMEDQKRAEADRERMRAQLQEAQKLESIGTLASGVAHEINNPIMGIMNYAQLILDELGSDSPVAKFATEIGVETERVATIVKDLLSFARQDKETHSSPARPCDLVASTLSLCRAVMRHDQISIDVDVPENLPKIRCRSQQMRQVIMNLLTNARDALNERYPQHDANKMIRIAGEVGVRDAEGRWERRSLEVEVESGAYRSSGDPPAPRSSLHVRFTIEDRGVGISEDLRHRIFDPFYTSKPRDKGTGLGLSISRGMVHDHGGKLDVESNVGQWTRFYVDLPVASDPQQE